MSASPPPIGGNDYTAFYESEPVIAVARINGAVYGIEDFDIDLNAHGATSQASITLPIAGNPDFSQAFANVGGTAVTGEIFVGWPSQQIQPGQKPTLDGTTRAYYGLVAQYDPKFSENRVTFELRSLASPLVDEKLQVLATNSTTVDFIQKICNQFGLTFSSTLGDAPLVVQAVLGEMYVGYANFSAAIHGMRIWDLILQCAQFDNVDVWEDQGTVYYAAPSLIERPVVALQYGRDLAVDDGLICSHALMFSKDIEVEVHSAQPRISQSSAARYVANGDGTTSLTTVNKITVGNPQWGTPNIVTTTFGPNGETISTKTVSGGKFSTGYTSQGKESTAMRYPYWVRNASPAYCNAFAITQWRKISQQEYTAQMRFPLTKNIGIVPLTALLDLSGAPYSKFNTTYYPRTIRLSGGSNRAFMYEIDAVSHELPVGTV